MKTSTLTSAQRLAISSLSEKSELVGLVLQLRKHGLAKHRKLTKTALTGTKKRELEELAADLAVRAQAGKPVHIAALEGVPACAAENPAALAKFEGNAVRLLTTAVTANGEATCRRCLEVAGETPEARAAAEAEEAAALAAEAGEKKPRRASAGRAPKVAKPAGEAAAPQVLDDKAGTKVEGNVGLRVWVNYQGTTHEGRLYADGGLKFTGSDERHPSPSAACKAIKMPGANGWVRFRYTRQDGSEATISALRAE